MCKMCTNVDIMKEETMIYKEERETILNYDPIEQRWYAWTNIPAHIRKLDKMGWERGTRKFIDGGVEVAVEFSAPRNALTFRNLAKVKNLSKAACFEDEQDEEE